MTNWFQSSSHGPVVLGSPGGVISKSRYPDLIGLVWSPGVCLFDSTLFSVATELGQLVASLFVSIMILLESHKLSKNSVSSTSKMRITPNLLPCSLTRFL